MDGPFSDKTFCSSCLKYKSGLNLNEVMFWVNAHFVKRKLEREKAALSKIVTSNLCALKPIVFTFKERDLFSACLKWIVILRLLPTSPPPVEFPRTFFGFNNCYGYNRVKLFLQLHNLCQMAWHNLKDCCEKGFYFFSFWPLTPRGRHVSKKARCKNLAL